MAGDRAPAERDERRRLGTTPGIQGGMGAAGMEVAAGRWRCGVGGITA